MLSIGLINFILGYYYSYGSGDSANKWMIFFEGGGWCYSVSGCYARALTSLGSSKTWTPTVTDVDNMNGMTKKKSLAEKI